MSYAQAERAISQLYESDSIRSELRDEEASLLMMWGEARLNELAEHNLPDEQFDLLSQKFRALLAAINVCVGKRKTSPSQHLPMMASISSAADAAGYHLPPDEQTTFLKAQGAMTNQDAISELLGLLKPAETLPTPVPVQSVAEAITAQAAAETITPQAAPETITAQAAPETADNAPSSPAETIGEAVPEVITPQAAPEVVDNAQPPQPEELPELPPQPPQEGSHDV